MLILCFIIGIIIYLIFNQLNTFSIGGPTFALATLPPTPISESFEAFGRGGHRFWHLSTALNPDIVSNWNQGGDFRWNHLPSAVEHGAGTLTADELGHANEHRRWRWSPVTFDLTLQQAGRLRTVMDANQGNPDWDPYDYFRDRSNHR